MSPTTVSKSSRRRPVPVRGAVLLAFALVAAVWSATYFGAEARMRRATARIVRLVEKAGAESPVALGLSANRLGGFLATNAVLELEDQGTLAAGKTEIVQFYANVRNLLDEISFAEPQIAAAKTARGEVQVAVTARYRLLLVPALLFPAAEGFCWFVAAARAR